jgi:hypothetical protein
MIFMKLAICAVKEKSKDFRLLLETFMKKMEDNCALSLS